LDRETRFHDGVLHKAGIVSGLVCPLLEDTAAVAALGWFSRASRRFTDAELEILDALMRLLAEGMTPEQELEIQVTLSPAGAVQEVDAACRRVTGFDPQEIRGKPIWETLLPASKSEAIWNALDDLRQGQAAAQMEGPLFKRDGSECSAAWTFTIVQQPDGRLQSVVGKGVVTPECPTIQPAPVSATALEMQSMLTEAEIYVRRGRLLPPALLEKMLEFQQRDEPFVLDDDVRERFRRPFPYAQRLAVWGGGRLPRRRDFFEVQCRDISATGFSFYYERRPKFKRIVVAVGPEQSPVYLVADVRHVTAGKAEHRGSFLVGCEFRGRVQY
jgi:PAS domain S-box-containing protein